jgi:hypothetical protein
MGWTSKRGISIIPYGIDLSGKLVARARERLPGFEDHLFVANGLTWEPPRRFDYVRTELCYVPEAFQAQFVKRIIQGFLVPDGKLLVAEYRSRQDPLEREWVDAHLERMGFRVQSSVSGLWEGRELTRIAVVMAGVARRGSA